MKIASSSSPVISQYIADQSIFPSVEQSSGGVHDFSQARINPAIGHDDTGSCPAKYVTIPASNIGACVDFRLKNPGADIQLAVVEVIMGNIFALTGLSAPGMHLVNNCADLMATGSIPTDDKNKVYIASEYQASYQDLGKFLLSKKAETIIDETDLPVLRKYVEEVKEINSQLNDIRARHGDWWKTDDPAIVASYQSADQRRFELLEALNHLLPEKLRQEQEKHYLASVFIDNWDHLNFGMDNFGYCELNGQLCGMTVDFGSSGPLAFQGEAKRVGYKTAVGQRPPIFFKLPSVFMEADAEFAGRLSPSLTGIASLPYGHQSESSVEHLVRIETDRADSGLRGAESMLSTALEVAYRIKMIPDSAIEQVVEQNWIEPDDTSWSQKDGGLLTTKEEMITIMKSRKKDFVEHYGIEALERWEEKPDNKIIAAQARMEVSMALKAQSIPSDNVFPLQARSGSL